MSKRKLARLGPGVPVARRVKDLELQHDELRETLQTFANGCAYLAAAHEDQRKELRSLRAQIEELRRNGN